MSASRALTWATIFFTTSACANAAVGGVDLTSIQSAEGAHGSAAATIDPTGFPADSGQRAAGAGCPETSDGGEVWRVEVGESDPILSMSVKSDAAGNVFVTSARGELQKLSASGETMWVRPFGSVVDVDSSGAIFLAGTFSGALRLGSSRTLVAAGGTDVFVAKLDEAGDVLFAVALGSDGDESATSIAAGADGVVVSGDGLGTVKLAPSDGSTAWRRPVEGAVAMDDEGDTVVAGALVGTESFDRSLTSAGGKDVLVVKLSPDGRYLWSRSFGDQAPDQLAEAVAVDSAGAVFVTGVVEGSVDFGGGAVSVPSGTCPREANCGDQAGFVVKLDEAGRFVWSQGVVPARAMSGVAVAASESVYAAGSNPGDVAPYDTPLLTGFDSRGSKQKLPTYDDRPGAGHAVATDVCGDVLFAFATNGATADEAGRAYVAKLAM